MKIIIIFIAIYLIQTSSFSQKTCIDSSLFTLTSSFYNDDFTIIKSIITKDSGEINIGYCTIRIPNFTGFFIQKKDKNNKQLWIKLDTTYSRGVIYNNVIEATNGNIIITGNERDIYYQNRITCQVTVLDEDGNLINQKQHYFTNYGGLTDTTNSIINPLNIVCPLSFSISNDSIMFVNWTENKFNFIGERLYIVITDNFGNIGRKKLVVLPVNEGTSVMFIAGKRLNNKVNLYGAGSLINTCDPTYDGLATTYVNIELDLNTLNVTNKKAYCSPLTYNPYFSVWGRQEEPFFENTGSDEECIHYTFLNNGHILAVRRNAGMEINFVNNTQKNRIASITEFDANFNFIKSEFISANRFLGGYGYVNIMIDPEDGKRHIAMLDFFDNILYMAVGYHNNYFFQKKLSYNLISPLDYQTSQTKRDPNFFTSFSFPGYYINPGITTIKIAEKDTALACFGTNDIYLQDDVPTTVTPIPWTSNYTTHEAVIVEQSTNFNFVDLPLVTNIVCKEVNICDTLKLRNVDTLCDLNQPLTFTVYKNPLCSGKINFRFDTAQVLQYSQINDTTLSLKFSSSYKGKIYAQSSRCNVLIDSANIVVIAPSVAINLGKDTLYCPNKNYTFSALNANFTNYKWQDGSIESFFNTNQPGTYYVTARDICNRIYSDTIIVKNLNYLLKIEKDTTICKGESVILKANSNYINYNWQPLTNLNFINNYTVQVNPATSTIYTLSAEPFVGCELKDTVDIKIKNCPEFIYFPTSFTPNNDGLNDKFKPIFGGFLKDYELLIYNRWGNLIFKTQNKFEGWFGEINTIKQNATAYTWICKYKFNNKPQVIKKGNVILVR